MKKVFINLFLTAFVCFQLSCTTDTTADNSNQAIANLPTAETNQSISKPEETPLPAFTSADEALAVGKKLLDEIETEKAVESLRQAIKLNPDLAEAHFNLGIAYALLEKVAERTAPPLTEATPTPTPSRSKSKKNNKETAPLTASGKSFENAVAAYKKILAKNPKDDVAHFNLGRSYNKLNEDEDAMKSLREAVKLKPEDSEYQTELGAILIKLAQYEEAVAALKKARSLDETNLQAESLLEKAEAGQKRVDFGNKPKLPQQQQQGQARPKGVPSPATNSKAVEAPTPPKNNANQ